MVYSPHIYIHSFHSGAGCIPFSVYLLVYGSEYSSYKHAAAVRAGSGAGSGIPHMDRYSRAFTSGWHHFNRNTHHICLSAKNISALPASTKFHQQFYP
jgi:hypothetical protein